MMASGPLYAEAFGSHSQDLNGFNGFGSVSIKSEEVYTARPFSLKAPEILTSYPDGDSIEKFSRDVNKVIYELRAADEDPAVLCK